MIRIPIIVAVIVFGSCFISSAADSPSADTFLRNGVTAHRGNSSKFPENTLPAFQSGIDVGADWIELDIFRTKDGKLAVLHDRTTGRIGDRDLIVPETAYEELAQVDVAFDFRRQRSQTLQQTPRQKIPLLEDVLHMVMKQRRTRVSIQPKMDCVAEAVALVKELKAEEWVGLNDGNLQYMSQVKHLAPEIPVFWDRGNNTRIDEDIRTAKERGFEALVLHYTTVTPENVAQVKSAGIEVGAWTVNDRATMASLIDMGVQRIYTDDPELLLALHAERRFRSVACEGAYPHHLQGICADQEAIYWSFTTELVKTDLDGRLLQKTPVANHHGDLCIRDGKLYVAVNLGKFNDPRGNADSWVYVYDAADLSFVSKHPTQEVFHGAGGIDHRDGRFFVVGGLPDGVEENYIYEYDGDFRYIKRHVIKSGHTHLGIQTANFSQGRWWFGCYGNPKILLVTDAQFNVQARHEFDCSLGIAGLPDGRFYVASGRCDKASGCTGSVKLAVADKSAGLRYVPQEPPGDAKQSP